MLSFGLRGDFKAELRLVASLHVINLGAGLAMQNR